MEPPLITTDSNEMLSALDAIRVDGGGDCEELAIEGLKNALEDALPYSIGFLVSDASAKDYELFDIVNGLVQTKQAQINFLSTGDCGQRNQPEFKVFTKIARISDGQLFDMHSATIGDILNAKRVAMEAGFVSLKSFDSDVAGSISTTVQPDTSFTKLSVSFTGDNAELVVKDSNDSVITSDESFSSNNIKILSFSAEDTLYTVEARATSEFSLRIGGISELVFKFGFSLEKVSSLDDTFMQPLVGFANILSIFVPNPTMLKCLVHASFAPSDGSPEIEIPLKRLAKDFFTSDFLDIPTELMRIKIRGFDLHGNLIERIISTGIESTKGSLSFNCSLH